MICRRRLLLVLLLLVLLLLVLLLLVLVLLLLLLVLLLLLLRVVCLLRSTLSALPSPPLQRWPCAGERRRSGVASAAAEQRGKRGEREVEREVEGRERRVLSAPARVLASKPRVPR